MYIGGEHYCLSDGTCWVSGAGESDGSGMREGDGSGYGCGQSSGTGNCMKGCMGAGYGMDSDPLIGFGDAQSDGGGGGPGFANGTGSGIGSGAGFSNGPGSGDGSGDDYVSI